ncbi:MAG: PAS domain S-box protein, partial [Candidatus Zixiibacteriota bacterium]
MRTEHKVIVLSILLGLLLWVADAALDCFIFYQGTFWGLLIYEIPPHEIYVRTLVLGCCVIFGVVISTVFGKFRRAEEKRRESEKQLRLAVKNSRDVLYKLNLRTGDFDYVSPSVVELGGYTPQEFILLGVKGLLRRIDPEDRDRFMMHFRNVLRLAVEDGLAPTIEYRWKHHDGEYRWFSDNRTVIRDGDGNPVSLIGSVRDVTVQKEAEKALGESEKKYRTLIETTQEGIGITSPGEELVFVNKAFASILGYEPSELVGRNLREFVPEERFEAFQMEIGKRQWGTSSHYETEMRHRDGSHCSLLVSASPLYDREGNYNGTLGMVTDITERKKAEEIQSALFRISQAVTSTANLEEFLKTTDEALGTLIDTANYYVALYDAEKEEYSFPYSVDQDEETDFSTRQLKRSLTDYVRRTGKPLLVDEETHRRLTEAGEADSVGRPSPIWLGTPLKTPRGVIGVAVVQHYSDPSAYSEADLDILSFVSGHIAVAIERKRAEEELRNSKEFAETIFNSVEDSISIIDTTDFRIVKANQSFLSKLNMEEKEVIGKYCYEVTHRRSKPCEPPDDPCPLAETLRTGCHSSTEHIHYGKDGREIYVEVSASPIINEKGEIPQVIHVARDITERKKAEEALRKAHDELEIRVQERTAELVRANEDLQAEIAERKRVEDALRLQSEIVANMAEGVQLTRTSDGVIVYTNPRFEDMFGYGHGELIGKNVSVLNAPSDKSPEDVAAEIIKDLSEEGVWYGEIQNIRKDGSRFWCRASVSTLRHGQHGEVWVAVHEDITARKRAEQELDKHRHHLEELVGERTADLTRTKERLERQIAERMRAEEGLKESEEKFRAVVENAPSVILAVDRQGTIQFINRTRSDTSVEEVIGKEIYQYVLPEYHSIVRETIDGVFESGKPGRYEIRGAGAEGGTSWYDTQVGAIKQDGKVVAATLITTDITERKKAEEALRESEEKFRNLAEQSPNMIFINKKGRVVYANRKCEEVMGYGREEFYSPDFEFLGLISPECVDLVKERFSRHMKGEDVAPYEYTLVTKDGRRIDSM